MTPESPTPRTDAIFHQYAETASLGTARHEVRLIERELAAERAARVKAEAEKVVALEAANKALEAAERDVKRVKGRLL